MGSLGSPTVRVYSTRQSLRKHEFAMDTLGKLTLSKEDISLLK
jgi:hypothetical protein